MGEAASIRMQTQFSWRACASKTAELYAEVLAERCP